MQSTVGCCEQRTRIVAMLEAVSDNSLDTIETVVRAFMPDDTEEGTDACTFDKEASVRNHRR